MSSQLLVLLPPSETKTDGGNRHFPQNFRWPELDAIRTSTRSDLIALSSGDEQVAARALKISAKLAQTELARNRQLEHPAGLAAIERYTGVLYDAIDIATVGQDAREWIAGHVAIHSALYGLIGADDLIAAYRLSHNSQLPPTSLKQRWRAPIAKVLAEHLGPILDLRSKGYVDLGPGPAAENYAWADVRERLADGSTRSLNHFNKRTKGLLVRYLADRLRNAEEPGSLAEVVEILNEFAETAAGEPGNLQIVCSASG